MIHPQRQLIDPEGVVLRFRGLGFRVKDKQMLRSEIQENGPTSPKCPTPNPKPLALYGIGMHDLKIGGGQSSLARSSSQASRHSTD